jgi:MoaA/NifB/PqqE/SkfB family radical SAM enzyme
MNNFNDNDAFCPLPWVGVYIEPNGQVDNCCISKNNLGNINNTPLKDILTGHKNIEIKSEMQSGNRISGCSACYPITPEHSQRARVINEFDESKLDTSIYDNTNNFELRYLDLRFRNTCNYACVYCSSDLSSTWAAELGEMANMDKGLMATTLDYILDNINTVNNVYLAGGEPLLMKENEIILEHLLKVNPNCQIKVNTNLSITKNNRIFEALQKFKNVWWIVSVDDIEERYNYIRYPGNWDNFLNNLMFLKNNKIKGHKIVFNMVYCALNAKTIFSAIDYMVSLGFPKHDFAINYIDGGTNNGRYPFDPRHLPKKYIQEVIEVIDNYPPDTTWEMFNTKLKLIKNYLNTSISGHRLTLFEALEEFDKRRGLDSRKVFPDIYEARQ